MKRNLVAELNYQFFPWNLKKHTLQMESIVGKLITLTRQSQFIGKLLSITVQKQEEQL